MWLTISYNFNRKASLMAEIKEILEGQDAADALAASKAVLEQTKGDGLKLQQETFLVDGVVVRSNTGEEPSVLEVRFARLIVLLEKRGVLTPGDMDPPPIPVE